jgi:hypothetical protein
MIKRLFLLLFLPLPGLSQDVEMMATSKPLSISGTVDIRGIAYSVKGIDPRRSPYLFLLSGSPVISVYGISIPLYFSFSEQEKSFRQPFNQFGLSPSYKWITLHGGYRNLNFSPYTLAGHTMLGAGVEVNPGKWRLGFMSGRLNRATTVDTTTGIQNPMQFSRYGHAVKVGYGTEDTHFDLSYLNAKDKDFKGNVDSRLLRPAANVVVGADLKLTLWKNFFLFGDGAVSIYTVDKNSLMNLGADSTKIIKTISKLLPINGTSEHYLAFSGGLGYREKNFGVKFAYRFVEPEFRSMGSYFFQNDLKNITVAPQLNLLNGRFRFLGSIGFQEDNVRHQKQATTKRVIGLSQLSWDITNQFGLDASYTNYSTNAEPVVALVQNKYLLTQTTSNISISPRLMLVSKSASHFILASFNSSSLKDLNEETKAVQEIQSSVALINYAVNLTHTGLSINTGANYTLNKFSTGEVKNTGFTLGISKSFLSNKLLLSTQNSYILSKLDQGSTNLLTLGGNAIWQLHNRHKLNLRINSLKQLEFSELTAELAYTYSLN